MSKSRMCEEDDWASLHFNHQLCFLLQLPHFVPTPAHTQTLISINVETFVNNTILTTPYPT